MSRPTYAITAESIQRLAEIAAGAVVGQARRTSVTAVKAVGELTDEQRERWNKNCDDLAKESDALYQLEVKRFVRDFGKELGIKP